MNQGDVLVIFRDALWLILKLSAPLLLISIFIGLIIAIFQAATQIHEQTLSFVPKIIAMAFILIVLGSWMVTNLTDFFNKVVEMMVRL